MSEKNLQLKQAVIDEISEKMQKATSVVVIDYIGITVDQANTLRTKLREAEIDYKVYKNTLVKRAVDGTENAQLAEVLEGPSAFAFGYDDVTAPARVLSGVMKDFRKMEFKAGIIEGTFYDANGMKDIAAVPPRDELIAKFMGSILSPIGKLVRTFAAIADEAPSDGSAPAEVAAPAEEPAVEVAEAPAEQVAVEAPEEASSTEEAIAEEAVAEAAEAPEEVTVEEVETPVEEAAPEAEEVTEEVAPEEEQKEESEADEAE